MNYKTTITSVVSAGASLVIFMQELHYAVFPPWAMGLAMFASVGGLVAFGVTAKDYNVTGGTNGQPSTPAALVKANQAPSVVNPPKPEVK